MEILLDLVEYAFWGLLGLIGLAVVFGKRIEKKWDYEAKFRDARRRELGELDIEMSRVAKDETDYTLRVKFALRHPALEVGRVVRVSLEDVLLFEAIVEQAGRIRLDASQLCGEIKSPAAGQVVTVRCNDDELFAEKLYRD